VPARRLVGARLIVGMAGIRPGRDLLRRVRRGEVGGVVLFRRNIASRRRLRSTISSLQAAARAGGSPPLLVAVDQEGGTVKRLPSGPPRRSPARMGGTGRPDVARREGAATARYLARLGFNVDLAPVVDVRGPESFLGSRAFGADAGLVSRFGVAFTERLGSAGVAATAKHFPGLGGARLNTDFSPSTVRAPRRRLRRQLAPFRALVDAGVPLVMISTAVYPAYQRGVPAALSRRIVTGLLREELGYRGVTVTDSLGTPAVRSFRAPARAAIDAAEAGVDLLLFTTESWAAPVHRRLLAAVRSGRLDRSELEHSYARIQALRSSLAP
jgi:beta-N-acetylhexosaminidase